MSELDSIRSFRDQVAAPSTAARASAREALLATARGAQASRGPRRLLIRRLAPVFAAATAVAVAGLAVLSLGGSPGVVERAEAAIDPRGRILHVVVRIVSGEGTTVIGESWVRPDGSGRSLETSPGARSDCLASEVDLRCYDRERNVVDVYRYHPEAVEAGRRHADLPGVRVDQPLSIHRAFASGYARLVGETEVGGRPVFEILLAIPFIDASGKASPQFDESTSPVLYLDRERYYPVAQRFPDAGSTTYYDTYEFVEADASSSRLLELPTRPGVRTIVHPVGQGPQG